MPLVTMKSDLSWYGPKAPGFKPNPGKYDTDFQYNVDLTATTIVTGFSNTGIEQTFKRPITTADAFPIDTALGGQGDAKRKAQRGAGSLFPIGPQGQIHQFDTKRTGWFIDSRYGDTFSYKSMAGLANTYTAKSPIDDMYNKFKVRDEVYDPYGYARPPFILRGIQRDDNSDPQRWGLGGTTAGVVSGLLDIPRGGPLVAGERIGNDVARIGKFLIRPNGLAFIAKQQLLRLMSPNTEGIDGSINKLNPQKIYNPVNTILSVAGSALGLRFRNYGLLPVGGLSRYEDIHTARTVAQLGVKNNRLNKLNNQRELIGFPGVWTAISGFTGPDSVGGIGFTNITKYESHDTHRWFGRLTEVLNDELIPQYDDTKPYLKTRSFSTAPSTVGTGDASRPQLFIDSREGKGTTLLSPYQKPSLRTRGQARAAFYGLSISKVLQDSLESQLEFHHNNINGLGSGREISGRTYTYRSPYSGKQQDDNSLGQSKITGDIDVAIEGNEDVVKELGRGKNLAQYVDLTQYPNFVGIPATVTTPTGKTQVPAALPKDSIPAIATYRTMAYDKLPDRKAGSIRKTVDFRNDAVDWDTSKYPTLESAYGYKPYPVGKRTTMPDPINNLKLGADYETNGPKDLIKFRFVPVGGANSGSPIIFRAYISSLSDSFSPSWNPSQDQGRADPKVLYASFGRSISVDFKVVVHSAAEQANVWGKLAGLAKNTYPVYAGGGFHGQFTRITIGDLYVGQYVYISSLSYNWDSETPWEITDGRQLPMYTDVSMTLEWVGSSRPNSSQNPFSYDTTKTIPLPSTADTTTETTVSEEKGDIDTSETPKAGDKTLEAKAENNTGNTSPGAPGGLPTPGGTPGTPGTPEGTPSGDTGTF